MGSVADQIFLLAILIRKMKQDRKGGAGQGGNLCCRILGTGNCDLASKISHVSSCRGNACVALWRHNRRFHVCTFKGEACLAPTHWVELICDLAQKKAHISAGLSVFLYQLKHISCIRTPCTQRSHPHASRLRRTRGRRRDRKVSVRIRIEAGQFQASLDCFVDGVGAAVKEDKQ